MLCAQPNCPSILTLFSGVLSIAFPYTSRDDMAHAMQQLTTNVQAHTLDPKDIDMPKFESELYTGPDPDLDIMVRTSGETRFSDFMIWESCDNCSVEYISTLWPAMAPFDMFKILFKYSYKITKNYGYVFAKFFLFYLI